MTNDGLVAYRKVGGPDGLSIVPDLATALPEISDDGLTYRFAVRDDVVYSNGDRRPKTSVARLSGRSP